MIQNIPKISKMKVFRAVCNLLPLVSNNAKASFRVVSKTRKPGEDDMKLEEDRRMRPRSSTLSRSRKRRSR